MRTSVGSVRKALYLMIALMISVALTACGGGGGSTSSTSPGVSGPATVGVSVASATDYPAGTTFAVATASPVGTSAPPASVSPSDFLHVWVKVNRIALIPVDSIPYAERNKPDRDGELEVEDTAMSNDNFVTVELDPSKWIDLLHPPSGAKILNRFPSVPAGEYGKIRVYYDSVVGETATDNVTFHPTAHYHFDVHFVGGNLVVPVSSDPSGGIRFFQVNIEVVGLKINSNPNKVLLRPQVFATVDGAPKYIVTGEADQVNHADETFVVKAVNDNISTAYGSETKWFYVDGRYVGPFVIPGAAALRDTALVDVIGTFQSGVLVAEEVDITFPDVRTGTADNVWIPPDNTSFIVRSLTDNVTVFPMPDRSGAHYDNSTSPFPSVTYEDIKNGIQVKARGYFNAYPSLDAYWISIGP